MLLVYGKDWSISGLRVWQHKDDNHSVYRLLFCVAKFANIYIEFVITLEAFINILFLVYIKSNIVGALCFSILKHTIIPKTKLDNILQAKKY